MDPITLDDKQYTVEELQELVGYGNKYKEFSEKYDTDPEKAWKSYGKVTSENAELRDKAQKLESLEKELESIKAQKAPNPQGDYTPEQVSEAKKVFKDLGVVTKEDMGDMLKEFGFVRGEDVDSKVESKLAAKELGERFAKLGTKYNGEDGRPKFDEEDMLSYMERNRISDPEKAYKLKYEDELAEWRAEKILAEKYPQIQTGSRSSKGKVPEAPKITKDNLKQMLSEKLRTM